MKIGVDGGGTKTELILIDNNGAVLNRALAEGCNPSVVGADRASQLLNEALASLVEPFGGESAAVTHTLLCMAGSQEFWTNEAAAVRGCGIVTAVSDAAPALELATGGQPGLVLHSGTGSFVAVRSEEQTVHFAAGYGWRLGDPGSAQDIGRRGLIRAVAELQGWQPRTVMSALAAEAFESEDPGWITGHLHRHAEPNRIIGAFAARVSAAGAAGDATACEIVLAAASELLACAEQSARTFLRHQSLDTIPAGLSGRILTQDFVVSGLRAKSKLALQVVNEPPIEGVRRLLTRLS